MFCSTAAMFMVNKVLCDLFVRKLTDVGYIKLPISSIWIRKHWASSYDIR